MYITTIHTILFLSTQSPWQSPLLLPLLPLPPLLANAMHQTPQKVPRFVSALLEIFVSLPYEGVMAPWCTEEDAPGLVKMKREIEK